MRQPIALLLMAESEGDILAALEALTCIDQWQIRSKRLPRLYEAGVRYRPERRGWPNPGVERFQSIQEVLTMGHGDCDDLACARAAELREYDGIHARPMLVKSKAGYHAFTLLPDGSVEDPSARLGMLDPVARELERQRRRGAR